MIEFHGFISDIFNVWFSCRVGRNIQGPTETWMNAVCLEALLETGYVLNELKLIDCRYFLDHGLWMWIWILWIPFDWILSVLASRFSTNF